MLFSPRLPQFTHLQNRQCSYPSNLPQGEPGQRLHGTMTMGKRLPSGKTLSVSFTEAAVARGRAGAVLSRPPPLLLVGGGCFSAALFANTVLLLRNYLRIARRAKTKQPSK